MNSHANTMDIATIFVKFIFLSIFLLLSILPLSVHAVDYILIDVGTLGGSGSTGLAINDSRRVTGDSLITGDTRLHAYVWDAVNGIQDLDASSEYFRSKGKGINNSSQVAGDIYFYTGGQHGFAWDVTNGIQDIGTLGGHYSEGNGINNNGQVTGYSNNANDVYHAFIWDAVNGMQDIGTLGTWSRGFAINDNGQITGNSALTTGETHAFIWDAVTGMQDIGHLGGGSSSGQAINSKGQVTGSSSIPGGLVRAFLWDPVDGMRDLGTLGGINSFGRGINSSGTVVGNSYSTVPGGTDAFIWDPINGMQNLCELTNCTSRGWDRLSAASGINENGDIVGSGILSDGSGHAFVALVIPTIDIWPNKDVNYINMKSNGIVQVAILSTESFYAFNDVNVESIRFGANEAVPISYKVIDVNNDRISDLRFSFALRETGIVCGDINATLIGEFYNEIPFLSSDSIVTKNCNGQ